MISSRLLSQQTSSHFSVNCKKSLSVMITNFLFLPVAVLLLLLMSGILNVRAEIHVGAAIAGFQSVAKLHLFYINNEKSINMFSKTANYKSLLHD